MHTKEWPRLLLAAMIACTLIVFFAGWQKKQLRIRSANNLTEFRLQNVIACMAPAYVPENFLQKPIGLKTGIGKIDFRINTNSPEAQTFFNQGMAYYYNFEYVQAARSFYMARTFDSSAAMIWFGLSIAYDNLYDTIAARGYIAKASLLSAKQPNAFESSIILLQKTYLSLAGDSLSKETRKTSTFQQLEQLEQQFPQKAETWLFASSIYGLYRKAGQSSAQQDSIVATCLLKALERNPQHFGAWHLLIHANEGLGDFNACLKYGRLYTNAAPDIPHAWHMYAHDLMKTGHVDEAIEKFNHAFALEEKKYKDENMPAQYDWHHTHNLQLLAYCYQYKGQFKKAESIFSKLDTIAPYRIEAEGAIRKGYPEFLLQNGRYLEAIQLAEKLKVGTSGQTQNVADALAGFGYLLNGDQEKATQSADRFLRRLDSVKAKRLKDGIPEKDILASQGFTRALQSLVDVGIRLQQDPYNSSLQIPINKFQSAMLTEKSPDGWISALYFLQLLSRISYSSGNMELAENNARAMLKHDPNYAGGYLWLAKALYRQGHLKLANKFLSKAKKLYANADADIVASLHF